MKIFSAVLFFLFAAVHAQQPSHDSSSALLQEFQLLADRWRAAYDSKDAQNLSPMYAENSEYISSHVAGYIAHGHDAVINNFQKGMDTGGFIDSLQVLSLTSSCSMVAVVTRYTGTAGGKDVDGRNLLVWKKIGGKWLVVTHMTSVKD
jgi:ketosteroid isomerase-like protein